MILGEIISAEQQFRRELLELIEKWEKRIDGENYVSLLKGLLSNVLQ